MNELLSDNLWNTIKRLDKKSTAKRAAVAYVTTEAFVKFGDGDILVTDASDHAIASGQTNAPILARAYQRGAQLYSLSGLHTKVLLLNGVSVIGSANLSESSANAMIEAAWVTDSPGAAGMVTSLIQQLTKQAKSIDEAFLNRILKIKVKFQGWSKGNVANPKKVRIPKHQTWIIGVHELVREFADEQEAIKAGTEIAEHQLTQKGSTLSWIRWTGKSRFRREAKPGDTVIQIWRSHGSKIPEWVYRHAPILHRQHETTCTRLFVEDFADQEEVKISWSQFKKLMNQVGLPGKVGPTSTRPILEAFANALYSLWEV
jgi:hypothetical protein